MYYLYIIKSQMDNSYYIGSTNNYIGRLKEHNLGRSRYTKKKRPWKLMYLENFNSLSDARTREIQIKSWKKRRNIEKLIHFAPFV